MIIRQVLLVAVFSSQHNWRRVQRVLPPFTAPLVTSHFTPPLRRSLSTIGRCAYINTLTFHDYHLSSSPRQQLHSIKLPSRLPVSSTPITLFSNTKPSSQTSSTMGGCGNASCSCSSCGCAAGSCTCGVSLTLFTFVHSHHRHLLFPKLPVLPSSLSCATTSSRSRTSTLPTNMLTSFTEISSSLHLTSSSRCPTSTSLTSGPR